MFGIGKATRDAEFTAFVEASGPALLRVAIGLTGSGAAARELVQASLVKAYVAWPRIRRDEAYAYTRRIMANERVDAWRSTRHESPGDIPDARRPGLGVGRGSRPAPAPARHPGAPNAPSWCCATTKTSPNARSPRPSAPRRARSRAPPPAAWLRLRAAATLATEESPR